MFVLFIQIDDTSLKMWQLFSISLMHIIIFVSIRLLIFNIYGNQCDKTAWSDILFEWNIQFRGQLKKQNTETNELNLALMIIHMMISLISVYFLFRLLNGSVNH